MVKVLERDEKYSHYEYNNLLHQTHTNNTQPPVRRPFTRPLAPLANLFERWDFSQPRATSDSFPPKVCHLKSFIWLFIKFNPPLEIAARTPLLVVPDVSPSGFLLPAFIYLGGLWDERAERQTGPCFNGLPGSGARENKVENKMRYQWRAGKWCQREHGAELMFLLLLLR